MQAITRIAGRAARLLAQAEAFGEVMEVRPVQAEVARGGGPVASAIDSGSAAQLTWMSGSSRRAESSWMRRTTSSFPTPVSPITSTACGA